MDLGRLRSAIEQVADGTIIVRTGTVVSDYASNAQTMVILDNDPNRVQVNALLLGSPLAAQTRVMMLAYPRQGLVIIGSMSDPPFTLEEAFPLGVGAYTPYVPVWRQGATVINHTVARAKYTRAGRDIKGSVLLIATSAGVANNPLTVTLPVTGAADIGSTPLGTAFFNDSGTSFHTGVATAASTSSAQFWNGGTIGAPWGNTGGGFVAAVAVNDFISFEFKYEAAS